MSLNVVSISGGKDSGAVLELALMRKRPFVAVMADTGNESDLTWKHVEELRGRIEASGLGRLDVVKADFTDRIAKKAKFVAEKWPERGVNEEAVRRALEVLKPTGIPFLDLCIWKGRFPSAKAQFCTEFLKAEAVWQQVLEPALQDGPVVQWIGVRRAESKRRAEAPMFRTVCHEGLSRLTYFHPLIHWTAQNVISFALARGAPINPLYSQGMGRVGCFPCIHANKAELAAIAVRYPEAFERIAEWEAVVKIASKRGAVTFFAADKTPEGAGMAREEKRLKALGIEPPSREYPGAIQVAEWSKTARGGRQIDWLMREEQEDLSCSSLYGLCE